MDKSNWVTKEQLDTPLCDVFQGVKTNGTAREYVRTAELMLGIRLADIDGMEYEDMNKYIDSLAERIEKL